MTVPAGGPPRWPDKRLPNKDKTRGIIFGIIALVALLCVCACFWGLFIQPVLDQQWNKR